MGFEVVTWPTTFGAWFYHVIVLSLFVCAFISGTRLVGAFTAWSILTAPLVALFALMFGLSYLMDWARGGTVWISKWKREVRRSNERDRRFAAKLLKPLVRTIVFSALTFAVVWLFGS